MASRRLQVSVGGERISDGSVVVCSSVDGHWTPEPFEADHGTVPFERFVGELSEFKFVALDVAIDRVLAVRGIDLVRTEWLKALGSGLHEFRVRHDADEIARMFGGEAPSVGGPEKVLLRVFVHFYGERVVLLLGGYDKGDDPKERRQQREIAEARRLLTQFGERQRRLRRDDRKGRS
jgi:hypothetical protein